MLHTKICVTSQESVGVTFIDWSIHFLSGQTQFFNISSNRWIELVSNPFDQYNAHNHKKNHPAGYAETNETLDQFDQQNTGVFTVYPQHFRFIQIVKKLNLILDKNNINYDVINQNDVINQIVEYQQKDYADLFKLCAQRGTKIIYVDSSPEINLYYTNFRSPRAFLFDNTQTDRVGVIIDNHQHGAQSDLATEFEEYFFKDAIAAYDNLTDVWDIRERQALNVRPFHRNRTLLDFSLPHLWIDSRSFWTMGEKYMHKILAHVGLQMDPDRLHLWKPIYAKWQNAQFKYLDFCHVLPHIIDSIINGWDYKLGDLTFEQEIVIQHCLIYQHNLNLKTWQLVKFPVNAKDLHGLLEPNIHQVESIY